MSISPASDIILDVARAADPARSAATTVRLARLAGGEPVGATDFTAIVEAKRLEPIDSDRRSAPVRGGGMPPKPRSEARSEAVKGLEQLVLQKLVESMLPKETSTLFGHGTAGDMWRSMLAQQLGRQIGCAVDLGVGKSVPWLAGDEPTKVATSRHVDARRSVDGPTDGEPRPR